MNLFENLQRTRGAGIVAVDPVPGLFALTQRIDTDAVEAFEAGHGKRFGIRLLPIENRADRRNDFSDEIGQLALTLQTLVVDSTQEQSLDHRPRLRPQNQVCEARHFAADGAVEALRQAEFDAIEDREQRGVVPQRFFQSGPPDRLQRRTNRRRRRGDPILAVPRLCRRRRREQPSLRGGDLLALIDHGMHETRHQRGFARTPAAFEKDRHRGLDPDQTRQPLRAARARKQADERLGKANRRAGIVRQHAIVRGEGEFAAAAEREARDRCGDRFATGLQRAQSETETKEMIVSGVESPISGRRRHHVVGGPDFR